jgi:hypothetical protein
MQGTVFAVLYQMRLAHVMLLFATQIDSQAERCGYRALQCGSLTTKEGSQAFHRALSQRTRPHAPTATPALLPGVAALLLSPTRRGGEAQPRRPAGRVCC